MYRLAFHRVDQLEHQSIEQYVDVLRDKAVDCEFTCPSDNCNFDYSSYAIRDRLIQGLYDKKFQTNILTHISSLPTLQDVIKHAQSLEMAKKDVCLMDESVKKEAEVYAARTSTYKQLTRYNAQSSSTPHNTQDTCTGCGKSGHGTYSERRARCPAWGKVCNNCGNRNHFSNVCRQPKNKALALVARAQDKKGNENDLLCLQVTPILFNNEYIKSSYISVLPDTGANICLAGKAHMQSMGIHISHLQPSKKMIATAGGHSISAFGWIHISLILNGKRTLQPVYFSNAIKQFYLSKEACMSLGILPINFPHCYSSKLSNHEVDVKISTTKNIPAKPSSIPFPPTEENIVHLEDYIKQAFADSTFNQMPPFPAMANTVPAKIHLKEGAIPYTKSIPIPVPLHWRDVIKKQIDDDVIKGVIEPVPVGEPITWCSQMVIIQKHDGRPRRTVDFQKLNSQCHREIHHCQPPFVLASQIPKNVKKTIFDAVDGYHAIPLDKDSKHLTTFITPWGAYRYRRLPQGFVASGDAYTRRYDELITDIPRKVKCVDDVLIWDSDISTAFYRAWDYLTFCGNNGIVLSARKFKFCRDEIDFAGLKITKTGIAPSDKMLNAIQNFPSPTNLTDARAWFGLVNQVSWAHADSSCMHPFRDLIKPQSKFYWDQNLEQIFKNSKDHLINLVKQGIQTFDTSLRTCLQTDWSKNGMGFLLLQKHCDCIPHDNPQCCRDGWKLTYAGSRFTKEVETRYSPTEGEATAVAWSLNKAKMFTLGCNNLTVATDHQPLLGLFNKELNDITNPRLLRIREKTLMFQFNVVYIKGEVNKGADAISRSPVNDEINALENDQLDEQVNNIPQAIIASFNLHSTPQNDVSCIRYPELKKEIEADDYYKHLRTLIQEGFQIPKHSLDVEMQSYWDVRDRLSITKDGVILMDERVVIPKTCRKQVVQLLHAAHQGVSTMRRRANQSVYWPRMNIDLKNVRENCQYCNSIAPQHSKEPLILTPDPEFPFQEVAADFFYVKKQSYLVLVDRYSGWFTVSHFQPQHTTSLNLIKECIALFSSYGAPEVFSSDGGSQFTSEAFQSFLKDWNIRHRVSAPHYPQSNGRAEAAVKTAKRIISDYVTSSDPYNHRKIAHAIIQHRNTPLPDLKLSPAQLLFHRKIRDKIPTHPKHLRLHKQWILTSIQRENLFKAKNAASLQRYNNISKDLQPLTPRDKVLILTPGKSPRWSLSGVVVMNLPYRRYKVKLDGSGRIIIRNRRFLRTYDGSNESMGEDDDDIYISPPQSPRDEPVAEMPPAAPRIRPAVTETSEVHTELRPYNNPGLLEDYTPIEYRTTRSGKQY